MTTHAKRVKWLHGPWGAVAVLAVLAGAAYLMRALLVRTAIVAGALYLGHVHLAWSAGSIGTSGADLQGVTVTSPSGEPIADVARIRATYDVHELLARSGHLYGLRTLDVERPHVVVVRHADGTWNLPLHALPKNNGAAGPPLDATIRVTHGSLDAIDQGNVDPHQRHLYVRDLDVDASVATDAVTHYTASLRYGERPAALYPIDGNGRIDARAHTAMQHWTAAVVPIAGLVDFAIDSPSMHVAAGELHGLDARAYSIPGANGTTESHLTATALLAGTRLAIGGLKTPVENASGRIDANDDGVLAQRLTATIAGVPITIAGGAFGAGNPQLRMAVRGSGDLARLRGAFAQSARLPMSGPLAFSLLIEGPVSKPVEWIALNAPHVRYAGRAIDATSGLLAFDGQEATAFGVRSSALGAQLEARGRVAIHPQPNAVQMVLAVRGGDTEFPYAPAFLPAMTLDGVALATSDDPKTVRLRGIVAGTSPTQRLEGLFDVGSAGVGTVGPLWLGSGSGAMYARVALDHQHDASTGFIDAHNYAVAPLHGALDAGIVGTLSHRQLAALGDARVHGAWGVLTAHGSIASNRGALLARYVGTVAHGGPLSIDLPASGRVDAPVAIAYDRGRAIVQISGARLHGVRVGGVPVENASATIAGTARDWQVYAARADVAGGHVLAAGSTAAGHSVGVSAANLPVQGGRASAGATIAGTPGDPRVRASLLLQNARVRDVSVGGSGDVAYAGDRATIDDTAVMAGPAFLGVNGTVSGVRSGGIGNARYDLNARVQSGDIAPLVALAQPRAAALVQSSLDANLAISGSGTAPHVSGTIDAAEGSVNGLAFRDLHAAIAGDAAVVALSGGDVQIGSTAVAFSGDLSRTASTIALRAPRTDLSDFNDFFDTGDTFAGTGALALAATVDGTSLRSSSGDAAFENVRYRRIDLGTVAAHWHARGDAIAGNLAFGGASGTVRVAGSVAPSSRAANLRMQVARLDLGTWLPMLGQTLPVTGRLDANGTVAGRYPDVSMTLRAGVTNGTAGRMPIDRFSLDVAAVNGVGTIRSAVLDVPSLSNVASGTFGLHPGDPLAVTIRSTSPSIAALARQATGSSYGIDGALQSTAHVGGTALQPHLVDDLTLANVKYRALTIARVAGRIDATRAGVALRGGAADLQPGRLMLDARVPLQQTGRGFSVATRPLSATLLAEDVEMGNFAGFFPRGTQLRGRLDGRADVRGTYARPRITGTLALANGSFIGPQERAPIKNAIAVLNLAQTRMTLSLLHADVGGGSFAASGSANVPSLRSLRGLAFTLDARADNAHLEMPAYFTGNVSGAVQAANDPAIGGVAVGGNVRVSSARVPLSAFLGAKKGGTPTHALPPIAFRHLTVAAGPDVRVQSGEVDIGGDGELAIDGTLAHPALSGAFDATGGTVSFYRTFNVEQGTVSFDRNAGIVPYVDAVATTYVSDPETAVRLHVSGPADDMNLALSSDPSYDREQILGLLVGAQQFGAVRGVASTGTGASGSFSLPGAAGNIALGQANQVFMRHLLEPLSASLGQSLGFTDLSITNDLQTGLGLNAAKAFGKNVTATLTENLGYPRVQAVSLEAHPTVATGLRLRMYSTEGPSLFSLEQPQVVGIDALNLNPQTALASVGGTNGIDFSWVKRFW